MKVNPKENPTNIELSEIISDMKANLDRAYLKNSNQYFNDTDFALVTHLVKKAVEKNPKDNELRGIKREFSTLEKRYSEYKSNYVIGRAKAKLRHAITKKKTQPKENTDTNNPNVKQKSKTNGTHLKMRFFGAKNEIENKRKSLSEEEINKAEPSQKKQQ